MSQFVIRAPSIPSVPVENHAGLFPVHRIYCVGRNFAEHAREMGSEVDRGTPVFFMKPADAVLPGGGAQPYPTATRDLHHEVELVVAIGRDAPAGSLSLEQADALVFAYGVGLDLTRRDLQAAAKAKGLPWDIGKGFDHSAPVSELVPAGEVSALATRSLNLQVNGQTRQHGKLDDLIWDVPDILQELSKLFVLKAGDLVFMGTPAGVGPLVAGDRVLATLEGVAELRGRIVAAA